VFAMLFTRLRDALRTSPPPPDIDDRTFVIWEPCSNSHGEIVPGYATYLLDLGYRVVVFLTPDRIGEGLFSRMAHADLHIANLTQPQIRRLMRNDALSRAAGIMVTTLGKLPKTANRRPNLDAVLGAVPPIILLVDHDARAAIDHGVWDPQTITLARLNYRNADSQIVNPHVFGAVKDLKSKTGRTVFLMVGAAQAKRRNQDIVFDAALRLVADGQTNFQIRLVGKKGRMTIPPTLINHVIELGRVDFTTLYQEVEACDFILTAFQGDNDNHAFYRTTGTSGSFQLCYGFGRPCIVQKRFVAQTALTAGNSLIYDDDAQMYNAILRGITMTAADYNTLQTRMRNDAAVLRGQSLANLRALIHDSYHPGHPVF
jgi:hypothetical protein